MSHVDEVEQIRTVVRATFTELGDSEGRIQETILIRDGQYCGRRFQGDCLQAIWFIEENEIKFYGADGSVIRTFVPLDRPPQRKSVA